MKHIFSVAVVLFTIFLSSCTDKGEPIADPRLAVLKFTTYTADTLQLKIYVNKVLLSDSLRTPQGSFTSLFSFSDSVAILEVINYETGVKYIDSSIVLRPGNTTISIVQFISGQNLVLAQPPSDPPPAPGNYKVRFQYTEPADPSLTFYDSVQCILRLASIPVDSFVLSQQEISPYFEAEIGSNYSMKIVNPVDGSSLDPNTNNLNSSNGFTDFNTAKLYSSSATNFLIQRIY